MVRNGTVDGAITSLNTDGTYIYGGGYTFGRSRWHLGGHLLGQLGRRQDQLPERLPRRHLLRAAGGPGRLLGGPHPLLREHRRSASGRRRRGRLPVLPGDRDHAARPTGTVTWEPDQGRYYDFSGQPAPAYLGWYPDLNAGTYTGQAQGPWSITGNSSYIVLGGEFTRVNNTNQQGLVRFAVSSIAPDVKGPKLFNANYPLNVTSTEAGTVRINWRNNDDDDNEYLTYRVYRDTQNSAGLKHTLSKRIRRWETVTMGFTDTGVLTGLAPVPCGRHRPVRQRRQLAVDHASPCPAAGDRQRLRQGRLREPADQLLAAGRGQAGTTASADRVGFMPLSAAGTTVPVRGEPGAIANDGDTASTFTGVNTSWTASAVQHWAPDVMTVEAWFKTTVTGGRIVGWSNRNTQGNSQKHDRQLYIDNTGQVNFGVRPTNQRLVVTSAETTEFRTATPTASGTTRSAPCPRAG